MWLKIEVIGEGINVEKGVANLGISKEEKVVKVAMELQTKFLEVTVSVLEKIDILVDEEK